LSKKLEKSVKERAEKRAKKGREVARGCIEDSITKGRKGSGNWMID